MAKGKNQSFLFFFLAIVVVSVFMFVLEWRKRLTPSLVAAGNKGIGSLFTLDDSLVAVFVDGRTCAWDWAAPAVKRADFTAGTGRSVPLVGGQWAAISKNADRLMLSIYDLDAGKKTKDLAVGWGDQDLHLRNSPGGDAVALIRRNAEKDGAVEVECMAVNLAAELLRPPVTVTLEAATQTLREFAVSDTAVLAAVGADKGRGRLLAMNLSTGQTLWDMTLPDTEELTTVAISGDGQTLWAGDRNGNLLTFANDGRQTGKVSLLEPGETRTVTNDFSVLNLVISPDGGRLGCTITPVAYVADAQTGEVLYRFGGHKVVAKVAFSPDGKKMATADLRADGIIRIHTLDKK